MKKIGSAQTKDQIADILREYVISGKLASEQEIVQEELADQLQLSRTPVREALQQLEKEGYLERLSNRHMRVRATSPDEIMRVLMIIAGIEYELMGIILSRGIGISGLEELYGKYLDALDTSQVHKARVYELEIHKAVSDITGYGYLATLHQRLLAGYPHHAIMNSEKDSDGRVKSLEVIIKLLKLRSKPELKDAVEDYYSMLAECYGGENSK
ncbi:MAG: GntR family transcriptional regulator [Youngiibacter sp.]|nr:GntR family transcriptional regulator [Youngiibacter sp.]